MELRISNVADSSTFPFPHCVVDALAWSKLSNNIEDSHQQFEKKTFVFHLWERGIFSNWIVIPLKVCKGPSDSYPV